MQGVGCGVASWGRAIGKTESDVRQGRAGENCLHASVSRRRHLLLWLRHFIFKSNTVDERSELYTHIEIPAPSRTANIRLAVNRLPILNPENCPS